MLTSKLSIWDGTLWRNFAFIYIPVAVLLTLLTLPLLDQLNESQVRQFPLSQEREMLDTVHRFEEIYFEAHATIGVLADAVRHQWQTGQPLTPGNQALRQLFSSFVEQFDGYHQIRLLDPQGHEAIRVNRTSDGARPVSPGQLQDKSDRYYFSEAARLPRARRYVSPIDLNIEHGQVEVPHRPMIRFAMAVRDTHDQLLGVVVTNFLADRLLSNLDTQDKQGVQSMLLNSDSYWLAGGTDDDRWGFMLGHPQATFARDQPRLAGNGTKRPWRAPHTGRPVRIQGHPPPETSSEAQPPKRIDRTSPRGGGTNLPAHPGALHSTIDPDRQLRRAIRFQPIHACHEPPAARRVGVDWCARLSGLPDRRHGIAESAARLQ